MLKSFQNLYTLFNNSTKRKEPEEISMVRSYLIVSCGIPKVDYPLQKLLAGDLDEFYNEKTDIKELKLFSQMPRKDIMWIAGDREIIKEQAYVLELNCTPKEVKEMMDKGEFYLSKHVRSYFDIKSFGLKVKEFRQKNWKANDEDIISQIRQENKFLAKQESCPVESILHSA